MRDTDVPDPPEAPADTQPDSREEENAHLWRIYRQGASSFVYAHPHETKSGRYVTAATSQDAARNACQQLERDELFLKRRSGNTPRFPDGVAPPEKKKRRSPSSLSREQRAESALERGAKKGTATAYACGHPRTVENTYGLKGYGACRTCHKAKTAEHKRNRRRSPAPNEGGQS